MYRKFLNVLLAGAMIFGFVSCKDYDDDIDSLNARLDNLESVTLASIESQISSIQSSIASLQSDLSSSVSSLTSQIESVSGDVTALESSLNSQLSTLESTLQAYVDGEIEDVEAALATLEASLANYYTKDEFQSYVNTLLVNYYTKTQVDEMFATATATVNAEVTAREAAVSDLQSQIDALNTKVSTLKEEVAIATSGDLSSLEAEIAELESEIEALEAEVAEFESEIDTLEAAFEEFAASLDAFLDGADDWFGEQFETYIAKYVSYETLVEYVGGAFDDLYDEILADLADSESDYYKAILEIVYSVTDEIQEQLDDLQDAYEAFVEATDATLEDFEERVSSLEKQIQSLSYVPTTSDGKVYFQGGRYITDASGNKYYLSSSDETVASVKFRVNPAALADSIANQADGWTWDVISNEATVKSSDYLTVTGCTALDGGYLVFTVSSSYEASDATKALMFSICIENEASGLSYGSDFIEAAIGSTTETDVTDNFALAKKGDDGGYTVNNTPSESTEGYSPITILPDYEIVYVDGDTIYSLEDVEDEFGWSELETEYEFTIIDSTNNISSPSFEGRTLSFSSADGTGTYIKVSCKFILTVGGVTTAVSFTGTHEVTSDFE